MQAALLELLQQGGELLHPGAVGGGRLLNSLYPLQLRLQFLQFLLDAGKLEVVLAIIVFLQGLGDEVFSLFLQFVDFSADGVLAVRRFRGQHRADALQGGFHVSVLVEVLPGDGLHHGGLQVCFLQGGRFGAVLLVVQPSPAAPHDLLFTLAVPGHPAVKRPAFPAHHQGREGVFAAVPSEGGLGLF